MKQNVLNFRDDWDYISGKLAMRSGAYECIDGSLQKMLVTSGTEDSNRAQETFVGKVQGMIKPRYPSNSQMMTNMGKNNPGFGGPFVPAAILDINPPNNIWNSLQLSPIIHAH